MAYKTFQYRIYPTPYQQERLRYFCNVARGWYNQCLVIRNMIYEIEKRTISKFGLQTDITLAKKQGALPKDIPLMILRGAIADLNTAFEGYFKRAAEVKAGTRKPGEVGYPGFRKFKNDNTIRFDEWKGISIKGRRIQVIYLGRDGHYKYGRIRVRWHRELEGMPTNATITEKADGWYVSITCEIPNAKPTIKPYRAIGLDLGVHHLLVASDGTKIDAPKWYQRSQAQLRRLQRKLDRQRRANNPDHFNEDGTFKRGKGGWVESGHMQATREQIARLHQHIARQRKDFIDNLVYELTRNYDFIAVEDLQVKNMVRNKRLAKSILNQGWGYFVQRLEQKALETGSTIAEVNPAYTSRTCSQCDAPLDIPQGFKGLAVRWVTCDCGMSLDRDHNAALNVLRRAECVRSTEVRALAHDCAEIPKGLQS